MGRKRNRIPATYSNDDSYTGADARTGVVMTGFPEEENDTWNGSDSEIPENCQLCERDDLELTRHHLIPRKQHKKPRTQKMFSRDEMKNRIAWLCRDCHGHVHTMFNEKQLAWEYNTLDDLRETEEMERFLAFIRKKK